MDFKEMSAMLAESATDSDGRYIPWWEDDFTDEECEYEDNLSTVPPLPFTCTRPAISSGAR